jgi:hypothetical protein
VAKESRSEHGQGTRVKVCARTQHLLRLIPPHVVSKRAQASYARLHDRSLQPSGPLSAGLELVSHRQYFVLAPILRPGSNTSSRLQYFVPGLKVSLPVPQISEVDTDDVSHESEGEMKINNGQTPIVKYGIRSAQNMVSTEYGQHRMRSARSSVVVRFNILRLKPSLSLLLLFLVFGFWFCFVFVSLAHQPLGRQCAGPNMSRRKTQCFSK